MNQEKCFVCKKHCKLKLDLDKIRSTVSNRLMSDVIQEWAKSFKILNFQACLECFELICDLEKSQLKVKEIEDRFKENLAQKKEEASEENIPVTKEESITFFKINPVDPVQLQERKFNSDISLEANQQLKEGNVFKCTFSSDITLNYPLRVRMEKRKFSLRSNNSISTCNQIITQVGDFKIQSAVFQNNLEENVDWKNYFVNFCKELPKLDYTPKEMITTNIGSRKKRIRKNSYRCKLCKKDFKYQLTFRAHKMYHKLTKNLKNDKSNEKTAKGKVSNGQCKSEKNSGVYKKHLRLHSINIYVCKVCPKTFYKKTLLKNHMLIHTEIVMQCKICKRQFRDMKKFSQHKRFNCKKKSISKYCNRSEPLLKKKRCEYCRNYFSSNKNNKANVNTISVLSNNTYRCIVCGENVPSFSKLNVHLKKHKLDKLLKKEKNAVAV